MTALREGVLRDVRDVRGIPGVVAAGSTSAIPFRGFDSPAQIGVLGSERNEIVRVRYVDRSFLSVL